MFLIIKKVVFLVGLTLYIISAHSQTVTSTRNGVWNDPAIWSGGYVPTSGNASGIVIDHEVELPAMFVVAVYYLVVNGKLTLKGTSQLTILIDAQPLIQDFSISGTVVSEEGAILNGTSIFNTIFGPGASYIHQQGPLGFIPYATWDRTSTFIINGFKDSGYINIAHSDSWKQSFGNVVYDCPQQTIFVVDLNGYLRNINGDFTVKNTNNKTLRLSTTQNPTINIGGDVKVEGPSEVWFSTNGTSTVVNIQKDFKYTSTSAGPTYLTTRGMITVNILGSLEWNSPGPLRMASSSPDSLGMRRAIVNLSGNLSISGGTFIAPPFGSGNGRITFKGSGVQLVNTSATGSSFLGNLDYVVDPGSTIDLGTSAISNTTGSLQVFGKLRVGSLDTQGAIQLTNKGNIHISGSRRYEPGSTIEYNGSSPQWIGNGHPMDASVNLMITNPTTTSLLQDILCRNFELLSGMLSGITNRVIAHGNVATDNSGILNIETIRLQGNTDQSITAEDAIINNISVNKSGGSVSLGGPVSLRKSLQIESTNTTIISNGNLTLLSTSDAGSGTAIIGPLPSGSRIVGDVTVQRHMSAEGKIFRYISSPVANASVASLMDDFAVTGPFADPTGNSKSPSLYYYDESQGSLQGGWKPYPSTGLARDNPLRPGVGYCARMRNGAAPVVWDVIGTLNQGDVELPVAMTPDLAPSNGWNLVGNPYACTIDWDIEGPNGWTKDNVSPVICIRDNGIGSWGGVKYWDGDINYSDIPGGQIAAGQSFWVKAIGSNPRLVAREGVKITNDASFYREADPYIPSFVLMLKRNSYVDKAYFKVRPGASRNFDMWDGIKMESDNFDISTLSDDGFSLAINSRDSLPCGEKYVNVKLKDLKRGTYKLELDTRFDFASYDYTWVDRFLDTETSLRPGEEIEMEITDHPESKSLNRFILRLSEIIPTDSLTVLAPMSVCADEPIPFTLQNVQSGIFYSIWENGHPLSAESIGNGKDLTIQIDPDSINSKIHRFDVRARSVCHQVKVESVAILQYEPVELKAPAYQVCENEAVTLSVSSKAETETFYWFASESSTDTLAIGKSFTTPRLLKSQRYFVSASLPSGCNTKRWPVNVQVILTKPASIKFTGQNLCSNYSSNNQWLLNGVVISRENTLSIDQPGTYILITDTLGCVKSDTLEFAYTELDSLRLSDIHIYPNPVTEYLNLTALHQSADLDIIGSSGIVCISLQNINIPATEAVSIDVKALKSGVYFAVIRTGQEKRILRFEKADQ